MKIPNKAKRVQMRWTRLGGQRGFYGGSAYSWHGHAQKILDGGVTDLEVRFQGNNRPMGPWQSYNSKGDD